MIHEPLFDSKAFFFILKRIGDSLFKKFRLKNSSRESWFAKILQNITNPLHKIADLLLQYFCFYRRARRRADKEGQEYKNARLGQHRRLIGDVSSIIYSEYWTWLNKIQAAIIPGWYKKL